MDTIFILENDNLPVGQIRLDLHNGFYLIDFSVDLSLRGKGYGTRLIELVLKVKLKHPLRAKVKSSNLLSQKVFERTNFLKSGIEYINGSFFYLYDHI